MNPRFVRHLRATRIDIAVMNPEPLTDSSGEDLSGTYNKIQIGSLKDVTVTIKNQKDTYRLNSAVVIYTDKKKRKYDYNAARILQGANVQSPFIFSYLHCDDEKKIALAAVGDLITYIREPRRSSHIHPFAWLSSEQLKKIMLHIIWAVHSLHEKGLVHRDIKPENILVFIDVHGCPLLKLSDLDDVGYANDPTLTLTGTADFFPWKITETVEHAYPTYDKKWLDCYALGQTLKEIAQYRPTLRNDLLFQNLFKGLKEGTITITDAINHAFFGSPPGLLARNVLAEHVEDIIELDNTPVPSYPIVGDSTLMKDCLYPTHKLANRMDQILSKAKTMESLPRDSLATLHQGAAYLLDEAYKGSNSHIHNNNAMFNESTQLLVESRDAHHLHLTTTDLQKAVADAAREYQQHHQKKGAWNFSGFFCFHSQTGIQRAGALRSVIDTMVSAGRPFVEVQTRILRHLERGEGNWSNQSFKTFLVKHLGKISIFPLHEWRGPSTAPMATTAPPPPAHVEIKISTPGPTRSS